MTSRVGLALLDTFRLRFASILFLHRFAVPHLGVKGHDPRILAEHLEYLRAHNYHLMSVADLLDHVEHDIPLERPALVFTVDDGYADFATEAAPVFAAYDCPVTVFLISDFVAGKLWNWFDKVGWAFRESDRRGLDFEIDRFRFVLHWKDASQRESATKRIIEAFKTVPDTLKEEKILELAQALEVDLPSGVPSRDRAMTWEDVRGCARRGVTFGPHTVTHPILSRVDDKTAEAEIAGSWKAILSETPESAVPVFCYPNGTPGDFSAREKSIVRRLGMKAALSTMPGSVRSTRDGLKMPDPYSMPRFSYAEDKRSFMQIASGLQGLRDRPS
jgi:peptidoglycan/xylan/chitin deacetylase (PgdA/CDA1 family)